MNNNNIVGQNLPRVDALGKVTGETKFLTDLYLTNNDMLHVKVLWSAYPHARIKNIDYSGARKLPGVRMVISGSDAPDNRFGQYLYDKHILSKEIVRSTTDAVAAVAADSPAIAQKAVDLIKVEYEELPSVLDPELAMGSSPPVVVHPHLPDYNMDQDTKKSLSYVAEMPNVCGYYKVRKGDVDKAFKEADLIIENKHSVQRQIHCQLENECCIAFVDTAGVLNIWSTQRVVYRIKSLLMRALGLTDSKIRVQQTYVGGAFGRFPTADYIAALMAIRTKKPVKLQLTREEIFSVTPTSVPQITYVKDGVKKDGTIIAREVKLILNGGAYAAMGPRLVRTAGYGSGGTYNVPNFKLDAYAVYTNEVESTMLRGVGVPQTVWAIENNMNDIAHKLNLNPMDVRKKNAYREGDKNVFGETVTSIGFNECLDKVADYIKLDKKPSPRNKGAWYIGKGISGGNKYVAGGSSYCAHIKLYADGTLELRHANDEVGQGCDTVLSQMIAEEFGVSMDKIMVVRGDTRFMPHAEGASSSRVTFMEGNAILRACADLKRKIFELAAPKLNLFPDELVTSDGLIYSRVRGSQWGSLKISDLFTSGILDKGGELLGVGTYAHRATPLDYETGQTERINTCYTYCAHAAEVAVNIETGEVKILRFGAAFDIGHAINPKLCEGQIEGGIAMGLGSALWEDVVMKDGKMRNSTFRDYHVPITTQIPTGDNSTSIIVEVPHPEGPYGAKGLGEAVICGTGSAVRDAINDAIGINLYEMAMTPEKILKAINEQGINKNK